MRRLWNAPGVVLALAGMAAIVISSARQMGIWSHHVWWSLLICWVVLALALMFRWFTDPRLRSNGSSRSNRQSSS